MELSPTGRELVALALRMIDGIDRELAPLDRALALFARRQPGCRADLQASPGTEVEPRGGERRTFAGPPLVIWQGIS